jgi:soluble lytic murein transglycosylase-like protein
VPAQKLSAAQRRVLALAPQVQQVARTYDIDPLLLHAIAHVESRHNPQAVSPAGALGLMQVMPDTARRFGVDDPRRDLFDPLVSLQVGSAYLKTLQGRFGNNLALVLAAYNAGEGAVEKHRRAVPPFAETQRYVKEVLAEYLQLKAATGTRR